MKCSREISSFDFSKEIMATDMECYLKRKKNSYSFFLKDKKPTLHNVKRLNSSLICNERTLLSVSPLLLRLGYMYFNRPHDQSSHHSLLQGLLSYDDLSIAIKIINKILQTLFYVVGKINETPTFASMPTSTG